MPDLLDDPSNVYRFRSASALLDGYNELSERSVFFPTVPQLNDPMEGLIELYWKGDKVLWENLVRNYAICLMLRIIVAEIDPTGPIEPIQFDILEEDFENKEVQALYVSVISNLQEKEEYKSLIDCLSSEREISKDEMLFLFSLHHIPLANTIRNLIIAEKSIPIGQEFQIPEFKNHLKDYVALVDKLESDKPGASVILAQIGKRAYESLRVSMLAFLNEKMPASSSSLIAQFPEEYFRALNDLIFPNWYTTCFSKNFDNTAMWSHYADAHKGCALIFRTEEDSRGRFLKMKGVTGWSASKAGRDGPIHGERKFYLEDVHYVDTLPKLNMFENIGTIPLGRLNKGWLLSRGEKSPLADIFTNENEIKKWRSNYHINFQMVIHSKLSDWSYENELRTSLVDSLHIHEEKDNRKFFYEISWLKGIIFGINTSDQTRISVIKLIKDHLEKSNEQQNFEFFQASLDKNSGKIFAYKLNLLG